MGNVIGETGVIATAPYSALQLLGGQGQLAINSHQIARLHVKAVAEEYKPALCLRLFEESTLVLDGIKGANIPRGDAAHGQMVMRGQYISQVRDSAVARTYEQYLMPRSVAPCDFEPDVGGNLPIAIQKLKLSTLLQGARSPRVCRWS